MNARIRNRLVFAAAFGMTLVGILFLTEVTPEIEIERAQPVLSNSDRPAIDILAEAAPVSRATLAEPSAVPSVSAFDRERFEKALELTRHTTEQRRKRWLSSKAEFLSSDLIDELLASGDTTLGVGAALEILEQEQDPLVQAVLLQYLGLCEEDPRVLAPLEMAARSLLSDPSRPIVAQLAVDGLLAAMGRQQKPVGALVREIAASTKDPIILRDLWFGFSQHGFDFAENREVLMEGLSHENAFARFGASESLRMLALDGALTPKEFVEAFAPTVLSEKDPNNQLLFLETLGAVGKSEAFPVLRALAKDATADSRVRDLAATSFAGHADPKEALAFCAATFRDASDSRNVRRAIQSLGVIASPEASSALAEIFEKSTDPATRRLALRSLSMKSGASAEPFLAAAQSEDPELRKMAAEQFMALDPESLSQEQASTIRTWQMDRARNDADPKVRSNAVVGAFLSDDAGAVSLIEERLRNDSDPEVRGTAASLLYVQSWARGDSDGCARVRAMIDNENPLVRSQIGLALSQLDSLTPEDARKKLTQEKGLAEFVSAVCPTRAGSKDVFGSQGRMLEKMLARFSP